MKQLPSLCKVKQYFPYHRICLLKTFILLLGCILRSSSVNLNNCKQSAPIITADKLLKISNVYARFIRFFKMKDISVFCLCLAKLSLDSLKSTAKGRYLILDRSNWKLGKLNRNILQFGISLSNGIMVPIFGVPLDKRGNSNESERIRLLDIVLNLCRFLGKGDILLADREFIGKKWFSHLRSCALSFVIRLRKDDYLAALALNHDTTVDKLASKIKRKIRANGFFFAPIIIAGNSFYYLVVKDNRKGNKSKDGYVRLLSDMVDHKQIIQAYKQRWQIEVYFAKTKKKGFNLEDIGLEGFEKVMLMATIVGYLYTLTLMEGIKEINKQTIKTKDKKDKKDQKLQHFKNRNVKYQRVSTFLKGLEKMKTIIFSLKDLTRFIKQKIRKKKIKELDFIKTFLGKSIVKQLKSV